ncbi:MAG TPA: hypothetical protein VGS15_07120 [Candidatus Acidoferrales bacterium]|nr:hypothetical protein [Candidatus Acidoferrales bacterium]
MTPAIAWRTIPATSMLSKPGMFEAPSATSVPPLDDYIQPTLNHALRVWWAYYWRTTLIAGFFGIFVSFTLRSVYANAGANSAWVFWVKQSQDYVLSALVGILVIDYILQKQFKRFRIGLISAASANERYDVPVTLWRSMRVWWSFTWRNIVGSVIGYVVIILPLSWLITITRPPELVALVVMFLSGFAVAGLVALFVIYSSILDEEFGDFRVALLPRKELSPVAPVSAPAASDAP